MDQRAFVTDDGVLWTFPRNTGSLIQCSLDGFDRDTLSVHPTVSSSDFHAKPIDNVFYQNGILCLWMQSGIFMYMIFPEGLKSIFVTFLRWCNDMGKLWELFLFMKTL